MQLENRGHGIAMKPFLRETCAVHGCPQLCLLHHIVSSTQILACESVGVSGGEAATEAGSVGQLV